MSWTTIVVLILSISCALTQNLNYRDVTISQGAVRGYKIADSNVFGFYSIPYATVPTGQDFYKGPLPPPTWNNTFEANDKKIICPHLSVDEGLQIQEQCLVANIYVPDTHATNLPVLVYVHGGAFLIGHGNKATPINLVKTGKVIVVTFNYRLGVQGFLCLGTQSVPGNAGIKDQVALLRWVQENIKAFGGNPNDVTIGGCSAGSSSVELLKLSKMTDGLFNKVISSSGGNLNPYSIQLDPIENAKIFARQMGFSDVDNFEALENFYLNVNYQDLLSPLSSLITRTDSVTLFTPCVEQDLGQEAFLRETPMDIIKYGTYKKVPTLYGFCEMEGIFRIPLFEDWRKSMNENFVDFLQPDVGREEEERIKVANDVKQFYFGNDSISNSKILNYVDYFTDVMFGYGMIRSARLQLEAGNNEIYLYEFSFADESEPLIPYTQIRGATHCAQDDAVMDTPNEEHLSEEYKTVKNVMRDLWLNFITTGKPVPKGSHYPAWPPMSLDMSYMSLNTSLEYRHFMQSERMKFWDNIMKNYYKPPAPPSLHPNQTKPQTTSNGGSTMKYNLIFATLFTLARFTLYNTNR